MDASAYGWLCRGEQDRERMLDMGPRVRRARRVVIAAVAVGIAVEISVKGWSWYDLPGLGVAAANLATLEHRIHRSERPERAVATSLAVVGLLMIASAGFTGGGTSPVLAWLAIPVAMTALRFRAAVVWLGAGLAALAAVALAALTNASATLEDPTALTAAVVLVIAIAATATALADAELQYRGESILDPLTGLLNRSGVEARFAEIGEQARLLGRPVCLIACDLDEFKSINDTYGHGRGDIVLREVSYAMRKALRSFELFYRLGGEEFLILLPGVDSVRGAAIGETLRAAVADCRPDGLDVTASFGVSAASGDVEYAELYRRADDALYRAKAAGRDTVVVAEAGTTAPQTNVLVEPVMAAGA
jgi:diguanylate cyclase (GGDEF)-like protein